MYKTIIYELVDGIATICLDRPQAHNAINQQMHMELPRVWTQFKEDPEAIVAIVTGSGDRTFCSGADVRDLPQLDGDPQAGHHNIRWTSAQNQVMKPVILAINGLVNGGGLHFVADSDIIIASNTATFGDSHVSLGLVSGLEPVSLSRKMPMEAILRLALVGRNERMSATRAFDIGMIGELTQPEQLMLRAREIAHHMTSNSPTAMARTKRAILQSLETPLGDALDHAWDLISEHNEGPDFREGIAAFRQQRTPQWQDYQGEGDA